MKKITALLLALILGLGLLAVSAETAPAAKPAKYVFFFIGDGMGSPQISATQYYLGTRENPDAQMPIPQQLSFTGFQQVGIMTTYDATSFCPDSASTASSMAAGEKTLSGVINYDVTKERRFKLITKYAKEAGKKVGVISSVSLDHATPAAMVF
ncbi:MAG: alkaline phosphatase [Christensenellales bacterium]|jgi:alkaline phosphatase